MPSETPRAGDHRRRVASVVSWHEPSQALSPPPIPPSADRLPLEMIGLTRFADRFPHQLSGGMKQRVAIARVLANEASILLMDEPFGALDALTREQLQSELLQIWARTKVTVLFVTHSVEEATLLADRVLVMTAGPGRVQSDMRISLTHPRDVSAADFNAVRRTLTQQLSR